MHTQSVSRTEGAAGTEECSRETVEGMYAPTCVRAIVCVCVRLRTSVFTCECVFTCEYVHLRASVCLRTSVCTYVRV